MKSSLPVALVRFGMVDGCPQKGARNEHELRRPRILPLLLRKVMQEEKESADGSDGPSSLFSFSLRPWLPGTIWMEPSGHDQKGAPGESGNGFQFFPANSLEKACLCGPRLFRFSISAF